VPAVLPATDFYWRGSAAGDNIDLDDNWWTTGHPASGDNLFFNNSEGVKQPYCNYGSGSWFGNIIVNNNAKSITWSGDTTYAYKFENNDSPDLFKIQSNIGNRSGADLEINPVGSGGLQITGNINIADNDKWLKIYGSQNLAVSGIISGNPGVDVTIFDTPTVTLSGANTWPDAFNIYGGTVILKNTDPLDAAMINLGKSSGTQSAALRIGDFAGVVIDTPVTVVSGGTGTKTLGISYAGEGEFSGDITLNDNLTLNGVSGSTLLLSGDISGAGKAITVDTFGTVVLSGNNTSFGGDSGRINIEQGTLEVSANGDTGANPGSAADYIFLNNWATLRAADTFTLSSKKIIVLSGDGKIDVNENKTLSYSGDISGAYRFAKAGLGTLQLGTSSDFSDATNIFIDAGTLWTKNTQPFDGTDPVLYLGATSGTAPAAFQLGSGSSTKSLDEPVIVRSGSSGTKTLANGNTANNCNFNGKISLEDDLTVNAAGGSSIVFAGKTDMSAAGDHSLTLTGPDNVEFSGQILADSGTCHINHNGSGILEISADNSTGITNLMMLNINSSGTVLLSDSDALGNHPAADYPDKINFYADGRLSNRVDITISHPAGITIADGVTAEFAVGDEAVDDLRLYCAVRDGAANDGGILKTGPGTLYLYATNTYGGNLTINAGVVRFADDVALGTVPATAVADNIAINGGTLHAPGHSVNLHANRGISLGSSGGTLYNSKILTINGIISGSGSLTKEGGGSLRLANNNTYTNKTIITDGEIRITSDTNLGAPPAAFHPSHLVLGGTDGRLYAFDTLTLNPKRGIEISATTGILKINNNKTLTYNGIISGTGDLQKDGNGTLVLGGANTYSGTTTVTDGSLIVNGSIASAVTVADGAFLSGSGSIAGAVTLNSGGTIRAGIDGSPATLDTGDLSLSAGATLQAELNGAAAGTQYSRIEVNGSANINGAEQEITLNYAPAPGARFFIITNDGTDAVTGTFAGLPEGASLPLSYNGTTYTFTIHYTGDSLSGHRFGGNDVVLVDTRSIPTSFMFK